MATNLNFGDGPSLRPDSSQPIDTGQICAVIPEKTRALCEEAGADFIGFLSSEFLLVRSRFSGSGLAVPLPATTEVIRKIVVTSDAVFHKHPCPSGMRYLNSERRYRI